MIWDTTTLMWHYCNAVNTISSYVQTFIYVLPLSILFECNTLMHDILLYCMLILCKRNLSEMTKDVQTIMNYTMLCIILDTRFSFSYTLGCEYWVPRNWYSWLLFTSEDCFPANLCMQQQSANMTSLCQYPTFMWRHRSTVVTSQYWVRKDRP